TFPKFLEALKKLPITSTADTVVKMDDLSNRRPSILSTREVVDVEEGHEFVKGKKLTAARPYALSRAFLEALLGREISETTAALGEEIFESLIDHGGNVSGAVNTMVTARAGKDMMASLASGILTIGPRFGGAVNSAAAAWLEGVASEMPAAEFVEKK